MEVIGNQNSCVTNSLQNTFMFHKIKQVIQVWVNNNLIFLGELIL